MKWKRKVCVSLVIVGALYGINTSIGLGVSSDVHDSVAHKSDVEGWHKSKADDGSRLIDNERTQLDPRIEALQHKLQTLYLNTFKEGGLDGPTRFEFEDQWCIARQDLSEGDQRKLEQQRDQWNELTGTQGRHLYFDDVAQAFMHWDLKELAEYGLEHDDVVAMRLVVERFQGEQSDKYKAARRLFILGERQSSIHFYVGKELESASDLQESGEIEKARLALTRAYAFAEYSFMRRETNVLIHLQVHFSDLYKPLLELVDSLDPAQVSKIARGFYNWANEQRLAESLPPLEEFDNSKAAKEDFSRGLASLYHHENGRFISGKYLNLWRTNYLQKTPCLKRRIAYNKYSLEQYPEILKQMYDIEQETRHETP